MVQFADDIRRAAPRARRLAAFGIGAAVVVAGLSAAASAQTADGPAASISAPPAAETAVQSVVPPVAPATAEAAAIAAGEAEARCRVGAEAHPFRPDLPIARLEVRERGRLTIVALGSSSTEGVGASDPEHSYPALLKAELHERLPNIAVTVVNAGVGGQIAHEMLMRLDTDVVAKRPSLVIWQTGVNDAIRDVGTDRFVRVLERGIGRLRATGSDIVLMDMQWLPQAERYPHYAAYRDALAETAAGAGVDVFPRYSVMQDWAQSGEFDTSDLVAGDRLHMSDVSYQCLAVRIADGIVQAVEGVQPPPLLSGTPRRSPPLRALTR